MGCADSDVVFLVYFALYLSDMLDIDADNEWYVDIMPYKRRDDTRELKRVACERNFKKTCAFWWNPRYVTSRYPRYPRHFDTSTISHPRTLLGSPRAHHPVSEMQLWVVLRFCYCYCQGCLYCFSWNVQYHNYSAAFVVVVGSKIVPLADGDGHHGWANFLVGHCKIWTVVNLMYYDFINSICTMHFIWWARTVALKW